MSEIFELKGSHHIRTAFKSFYKDMEEKGFIKFQHQLFTYAFLVGIIETKKFEGSKNTDVCQVHNIDEHNLAIIKGIALQKLNVNNGSELLKEIMDYADGGIQMLQIEFENNGTIRLDKYLE